MEDLTNKKIGMWTVIKKDNKNKWICQCDCGTIRSVIDWNLVKETSKSCGCTRGKSLRKSKVSENGKRRRIYNIYNGMKTRCYNSNVKQYSDYGGRGIKICDMWLNNYDSFYDWSILNEYNDNLTIDRIDLNGNYSPKNCKWSTMKEQNSNKRNNHLVTIKGVTKNYSQWAEESGIARCTIKSRIERGWNPDDVLNEVRHVNFKWRENV